jgi:FkbM family methyltransferase
MIDFVKNLLRRYLRHPGLYARARRAMLLGQMLLRRPDEADYRALTRFRHKLPLVLDVGANGGQSAAAFSFLLPGWRIVSFEPNPGLWGELAFIAARIGPRFELRKVGLGDRPDRFTLYVPRLGALPLTTRASVEKAAALEHCASLEVQFGQPLDLIEQEIDVVTLDSLDLAPGVVKIDVEGFELAVLEGMRQTIARHRPVILLENNARNADCRRLLGQNGYVFAWYHADRADLRLSPSTSRNWFAIPQEEAAGIAA